MKIKTLTFLGFSLEEISRLLDAESTGDYESLRACFRKKIEETQSEIWKLQRIEGILHGACIYNEKNGKNGKIMELFEMSVTEPVIKEIPEMRIVSKREIGTYGVTIGKLIHDICACVGSSENQRNRVKITGPIMFLGHDEEYKETDADIEIAIPVTSRISVEDLKMEIKTLPAIRAVSVIYRGPYHGVEAAYNRIFSFTGVNNLEPFGPNRELYFNDPAKVPEEELITEVQIPVREK